MALDLRAQLSRTSVCFRSHTASWIKSVVQSCKIHGLHSDCMDNETEMDMADEVDGKDGTDELSTIIGPRTVTLNTVRHSIIRPARRTSCNALFCHYSGSGHTDHTRGREKPDRPHCVCEVLATDVARQ